MNADKKILHLATGDKFLPKFIDFVNSNFPKSEHTFLILKSKKTFFIKPDTNIIFLDECSSFIDKYKVIVKNLNFNSKVILHGFFNVNLIFFFIINFKYLKKCMWVIWGGDLYTEFSGKNKYWEFFMNFFRTFIFKKLGAVISYLESDYEHAQLKFKVKAPYFKSFVYLSNLFKGEISKANNDSLAILVGNSATKSNNHAEAFEKIKSKIPSIKYTVYTPLSYGDEKYADEIIRLGRSEFGENFVPLLEFMNKKNYNSFLSRIDIAIFNHERQQAMGNTIQLLGLGKKVYLQKSVSQFKAFEELGLKIFDINDLSKMKISENDAISNNKIINNEFSKDRLKKQLETIFNYIF